MYIGKNTLRNASVEIVRCQRTIYARSIAQLFQTENQRSVFRLSACQKTFDRRKKIVLRPHWGRKTCFRGTTRIRLLAHLTDRSLLRL